MADVLDSAHHWHDGHGSSVQVCSLCIHEGRCCLMVDVNAYGAKHKAICRACFNETGLPENHVALIWCALCVDLDAEGRRINRGLGYVGLVLPKA